VKRFRQVAAYILAGGASSRMGQDKGLLEFSGVPLIVRTARLIEPLVAGITIVGSPGRYAALGLSAIPDKGVARKKQERSAVDL
jgi:molybdopterin-guanine dinucleotide biosynthesis protein A